MAEILTASRMIRILSNAIIMKKINPNTPIAVTVPPSFVVSPVPIELSADNWDIDINDDSISFKLNIPE